MSSDDLPLHLADKIEVTSTDPSPSSTLTVNSSAH